MAALWDVSIKEDCTRVESGAVITVPGNRVMNGRIPERRYPNGEDTGRRPAILARAMQEAWLHGAPEGALACLKPYAAT